MCDSKNYGFTLIEILIAIAVIAVLSSVAIYNVNFTDKVSTADELLLKQVLTDYIPQQVMLYYLSTDSTAWADKVAQIQNEMASWQHIKKTSAIARVYKGDGIELNFNTVYEEQERNKQLRDLLATLPMVESATAGGYHKQRFTIKYKLN
ncbi:MAG: prepilin-type N-terminal cleavage/methylation domain-containing protein [Chromatiales bacterium]|nr:prepilin-type N-terminal cleavage/methylation domain-containing protein [Chromatiales bacterium]